jgi:hypothetical protein
MAKKTTARTLDNLDQDDSGYDWANSFFTPAPPSAEHSPSPDAGVASNNGIVGSVAVQATVAIAPTPTVAANNVSLLAGQTIAGGSLIHSTTGNAVTEYAFMDNGSDGGQLYYNGKALTDGVWWGLTPAQMAQLTYVGGTGAGTDKVSIEVFDGHAWSTVAVASITQTVPAAPAPNTAIVADIARLEVNNSLSYSSMLTILQDAAVGGMTASKFSTLQALASELDKVGGISTTAYVQSIAQDVIDGNGANATWNGGSSTAVALGNLSATSSATQVGELVGEWFLGTDLPGTNVASIGESNLNSTYQMSTSPLYASSGAPSYLDVNQGYDGDCYFLSSIAVVALEDPTGIESMITNNGNGTYGVKFDVNGQADYVTVNDSLPNMPTGYSYANGSKLEFANGSVLWPELLEKAYAELNAQPNAPHGADLDAASDSYAGISAGGAYALTEITGQSVNTFNLGPSTSASTLASDNTQLGAAFSGHEEMLVSTSNNSNGNLVGDHMFEVVGYNATSDMLTLHNPWGAGYSGPLAMTFNESLASLAANNCSVYATAGKPLA